MDHRVVPVLGKSSSLLLDCVFPKICFGNNFYFSCQQNHLISLSFPEVCFHERPPMATLVPGVFNRFFKVQPCLGL